MLNVNEISPGIVVYACVDTLYNEGVRTTLRNTHPMLCIDCNATESEWVILTSMFTELEVKSRWKLGPVNWLKKKSYIDTARSSHRIPNDVMQKASEIGESDYYHERYERPMVRPAGVAAIEWMMLRTAVRFAVSIALKSSLFDFMLCLQLGRCCGLAAVQFVFQLHQPLDFALGFVVAAAVRFCVLVQGVSPTGGRLSGL